MVEKIVGFFSVFRALQVSVKIFSGVERKSTLVDWLSHSVEGKSKGSKCSCDLS